MKKKIEREKRKGPSDLLSTPREREREILEGTGTASTSMELTDRPDLALARDRWQQ